MVSKYSSKQVVIISSIWFSISSVNVNISTPVNELSENGSDVKVEWLYRDTDEDMYEVGQDYAYMVRVPFEFKMYEDLVIA